MALGKDLWNKLKGLLSKVLLAPEPKSKRLSFIQFKFANKETTVVFNLRVGDKQLIEDALNKIPDFLAMRKGENE